MIRKDFLREEGERDLRAGADVVEVEVAGGELLVANGATEDELELRIRVSRLPEHQIFLPGC